MDELDTPKSLNELLEPGMTIMVGMDPMEGAGSPGDGFQSRPLTVAAVDGDTICVLIDGSAEWTDRADDAVMHVTVSDNRENVWVSMNARSQMSRDPREIDELWSPFAGAYFDNGRETPGIAVMHLHVMDGRYWTSPSGRIGSIVSMVRAKFGDSDDSGEHGNVAL